MRDVVVAELDTPEHTIEAALRVRELGYYRVEAYTPFPIPELDEVLAIRRTRLPYVALIAGLSGAAVALFIQWWTNAFDYPINVGGRPLFSIPTSVLIVFETTVLFAAFAAFAGVLIGARLPRLHDPLFDLPGFERTRIDRFWIVVGDVLSLNEDIIEAQRAEPPDERRAGLLRSIQDEQVANLCATLEKLGAVVIRGRVAGDEP